MNLGASTLEKPLDPLAPVALQMSPPFLIRDRSQESPHPLDFWLIGGASLIAWIFSVVAENYANTNPLLDRQIMSWPYAFAALTLICNHPHFISSYRIGYGRGWAFLREYWIRMIAVPVGLLALFTSAYFLSGTNLANVQWLSALDETWPDLPVLGTLMHSPDLGSDLLRTSVWMMWFTVGWHYAKQTYGIMLVYAGKSRYGLTEFQKTCIKVCVLSVVPTSLMALSKMYTDRTASFQDLPLTMFEIPDQFLVVSQALNAILLLAVILMLAEKYFRDKKVPPLNFLMAFFTFYIWWFPGIWPQPYGMFMVPFFHSLQYLPFAYRRLKSEFSPKINRVKAMTRNITVFLVVGFLFFDLIPGALDQAHESRAHFGSSFFIISFAVFLNLHHFFIDSAIWRRPQK